MKSAGSYIQTSNLIGISAGYIRGCSKDSVGYSNAGVEDVEL